MGAEAADSAKVLMPAAANASHVVTNDARRSSWAAVIALAVATVALLVWAVLPANPADLSVFMRAGRDVLAGRDPYVTPGTPAVWSGSAFVYPWAVALPFAALDVLPKVLAIAVFRVVSTTAVVVGCRLAGCRRPVALIALLGSSVFVLGLQQGTLDALLFFGVVLAWRLRDRAALLAPILTCLVVSELFMWPLLVWAWFTGRKRAAISAGVLSVLVIVAGSLAGEPLPAYLRSLSELSRHEGPNSSSLFALASHAGLPSLDATVLAVLAALTVLAVAVLVERRTRTSIGLIGAVGASLIATPILWSHYLLLLALPLVLADMTDSTRLTLLGLFDAATWARYTPYRSTLAETIFGTAVALVILGLALWRLPSRRSLANRLLQGLRRLPVALDGLVIVLLVLAFLADDRGLRIVIVQVAIVFVVAVAPTALPGPVGLDP